MDVDENLPIPGIEVDGKFYHWEEYESYLGLRELVHEKTRKAFLIKLLSISQDDEDIPSKEEGEELYNKYILRKKAKQAALDDKRTKEAIRRLKVAQEENLQNQLKKLEAPKKLLLPHDIFANPKRKISLIGGADIETVAYAALRNNYYLNQEVNQLRQSMHIIMQSVHDILGESYETKELASKVSQKCSQLERHVSNLRSENDTLKHNVHVLLKDSEILKQDSMSLKKERDSMKESIEQMKSNVDHLLRDTQVLRKDLVALTQRTQISVNNSEYFQLCADLVLKYNNKIENLAKDRGVGFFNTCVKFDIKRPNIMKALKEGRMDWFRAMVMDPKKQDMREIFKYIMKHDYLDAFKVCLECKVWPIVWSLQTIVDFIHKGWSVNDTNLYFYDHPPDQIIQRSYNYYNYTETERYNWLVLRPVPEGLFFYHDRILEYILQNIQFRDQIKIYGIGNITNMDELINFIVRHYKEMETQEKNKCIICEKCRSKSISSYDRTNSVCDTCHQNSARFNFYKSGLSSIQHLLSRLAGK